MTTIPSESLRAVLSLTSVGASVLIVFVHLAIAADAPPKPKLAASSTLRAAEATATFSPADLDFFEKQVRPLLAENCFKCHNDKKQKGSLRLDARSLVLKGGDQGPAIDLAKPENSLLLKAISYTDDAMQMPPDGKLPPAKIDILTKWVKAGAPWTPGQEPVAAAKPHGEDNPESRDPEKNRDYWAYRLLAPANVPQVKDATLAKWASASPVDAFIAAKLEARGLKPVGSADRVALVRRAFYDLTGLPP